MTSKPLSLRSFAVLSIFTCVSLAEAAEVLDFESGFTNGQQSFVADGLDIVLTGDLIVTQFASFGSGGGGWFMDSTFGNSQTGNFGAFTTTSPGQAFEVTDMHLWSSDDGGSNEVTGDINLIGTLLGGGSVTSTITVAPTGVSGNDWDMTTDLSAFSGLALTSLAFEVTGSVNYLAIDKMEITAVPEPSSFMLGAGFLSLVSVLIRRGRNSSEPQ
jgi:hypothetical protein